MKGVSNEFLGAVFGAWIGVTTEIWKQPLLVMVIFFIVLITLSLMLSIIGSTKDDKIKLMFVFLLLVVSGSSGLLFTKVDPLILFQENQLNFYYSILISWLFVSVFLEPLHKKVTKWKIIQSD